MFLIDSVYRAPVVGFFIAFIFTLRLDAQVLDVPTQPSFYMTSPRSFSLSISKSQRQRSGNIT